MSLLDIPLIGCLLSFVLNHIIGLTIWLVLVTALLYYIVFVKLAYTAHRDPNIKEEYKPFERTDRNNWSFVKLVIGGFFFIPIRLPLAIIAMLFACYAQRIIGTVEKDNHKIEYSKEKRQLADKYARIAGYFIHFSVGMYSVKQVKKDITEFDPTYKKPKDVKHFKNMGPIAVSNHVSWIDIMILCASRYVPSFLSKKALQKYPFYGDCTTSLQSIYLDRQSEENKNQAMELIKERIDNKKQGKNYPVLLIFPEGTTTNGQYLISFKKGAFEPLEPVDIICLKYDFRSFHNAIDIGQGYTFLLQLCQWKNTCTMYELGTYYPEGNLKFKGDDDDWKIYADKIKSIMLKCLNVKNSEAGYRHMLEFQKVCSERNKQILKNKK